MSYFDNGSNIILYVSIVTREDFGYVDYHVEFLAAIFNRALSFKSFCSRGVSAVREADRR